MSGLRASPRLLATLAVMALLVRLLVPAGFMPQVTHGQVAIVACPGMATAGAAHHHAHDAPAHDGFERPCAFAGVAAAATLLALVVVLALATAPVVRRFVLPRAHPPRDVTRRWRPPLRAPPTTLATR